MKRIYLIIACFTFIQISKAQIKITKSDMPSSGDTIRYSTATQTSPTGDLVKKGTNQVWDFSKLEAASQAIYEFKPAIQTPYIFSFFGAFGQKLSDSLGMGTLKLENIWQFYDKTNTKYAAKGYGFSLKIPSLPLALPQKGEYTDVDEIYQFPLEYNDKDKSTFKLHIPIAVAIGPSIGNYYQEGTRENHVDGWGKITTPYAKDVACIRVKSTIVRTDSLAIKTPAINNVLPTQTLIEYKWLSNTEKIPLLEIKGSLIAGKFVASSITYRDNFRKVTPRFAPKASFTVDLLNGLIDTDTFSFKSTSEGFPTQYAWTFNPTGSHQFVKGTASTQKDISVVFSKGGLYTTKLKVTNLIGSDDTTAIDLINIKTGSGLKSYIINAKIHPNPSQDYIQISPNNEVNYSIININGKIIRYGKTEGRINTSSLSIGNYFILYNEDGKNYVGKFIKL